MNIYTLNGQFRFDGLELTHVNSNEVIKLEFRLAKLLSYLIQNPNTLIRREQLITDVWDDSIINDNTITWSISQLRKALADDAKESTFIETKPKQGYIFKAHIEVNNDARRTHQASTQKSVVRRWLGAGFGVALLICAAIIITHIKSQEDTQWRVADLSELTTLDGVERTPLLSMDNHHLYFLHRNPDHDRFQIYHMQLREDRTVTETRADGTKQEVASIRSREPSSLVTDEYSYIDMIWAKQDEALFASRFQQNGDIDTCEIVRLVLDDAGSTIDSVLKLHDCKQSKRVQLAYDSKNNSLYFTQSSNGITYSVYRYHLDQNSIEQITDFTDDGIGDFFIDIDIQQQNILVLRDIQRRQTEFLIYNIESELIKNTLTLESTYHSAFLGPDGETIWLNWGNDLVLAYELDSNESTELLKTHIGWNFNLRPVSRSLATVETSDGNEFDIVLFEDGQFNSSASTSNEYIPRFFNNGLVYVEEKQGLPQIWMQLDERPAKQLTTLNDYRGFDDLAVSSDGRYIAAVNNQQIGLMDMATQTYQQLSDGAFYARNLRFSDDNILYFTNYEDGNWSGYAINVVDANPTVEALALAETNYIQPIGNNALLYSQADTDGLFIFDSESQLSQTLLSELPANTYWRYANNTIYFVSDSPERGLYQTTMTGWQPERVAPLHDAVGGRFDIASSGDRFVFEQINRQQSNLSLVSITQTKP